MPENTGVSDAIEVPSEPIVDDSAVAAQLPESEGITEGVADQTGVEQKEEKVVPVHAVVAERKKWQSKVEATVAEVEELRRVNQVLLRQVNPQQQAPVAEEDPDRFLTVGELKALEKERQETASKETFVTRYNDNLRTAKGKYADFDSVIDNLKTQAMIMPELEGIQALDSIHTAPYLAYLIGKGLEAEQHGQSPSKILEKVNTNLTRTATLSKATGKTAPNLDEFRRVMNMPDEEFEKEWNKRKGIQ